jgi:hypothetical protein
MKYRLSLLTVLVAAWMGSNGVAAQELFIYPAKGQSDEQLEQDKFQCYSFAKKQTGFDPMAPPTATAPPPAKEAEVGGVGRGAVGGAVLGAAVGGIAGNWKKGAAIGGVSGGAIGGVRREEQAQTQWEQEQVGQYTQARNNYNRAFSACMEGRGYTVK